MRVELFCLDGVPVLIEPGGKKKMDLCPTLAGLWAAPGLLPVVQIHAPDRASNSGPEFRPGIQARNSGLGWGELGNRAKCAHLALHQARQAGLGPTRVQQ